MAYSIILHIAGEGAIAGEIEELPKPADTNIVVMNPRQRDGKDLHYIDNNVVRVIWPLSSLSFIEILESAEEEKIIGFVRD
ncbi:MAG: hypothetical protein QY332_19040 [Anaerolineales bacterium]|nr:MAG: hypothetical protein QY332_19040 [Anaerolineales bacterium]